MKAHLAVSLAAALLFSISPLAVAPASAHVASAGSAGHHAGGQSRPSGYFHGASHAVAPSTATGHNKKAKSALGGSATAGLDCQHYPNRAGCESFNEMHRRHLALLKRGG